MIVAILADLSRERARQMHDALHDSATILEASDVEAAVELLEAVPVELIVLEMQRITDERLMTLERLTEQATHAVTVCIAPEEVVERARQEGLSGPEVWLRAGSSIDDRRQLLGQAMETARLRAESDRSSEDRSSEAEVVHGAERHVGDMDAFNRLMGGITGGFDLDRLLEAFVDAVSQFCRCARYCLLWEADDGALRTRCHRGVRAEVLAGGRLRSHDALPTWYRRNRRVLVLSELSDWEDRRQAAMLQREMDLFGGQLAIPIMVRGRLAGILVLGEKVLGEGYSSDEIETLFSVTNHVALAAESIELHGELSRSKAYTDSIVESMGAGLITLDTNERIAVCNPYAAEVLGLERDEVKGADLRALPSPLGDLLYSALNVPDEDTVSHEVSIRGGRTSLRVSTSTVRDPEGRTLGSVLMLDDVTTERELAAERSRSEKLDVITKIVGRIAHEVKNPLTAVKTYAELMGGSRGGERLEQFWSETVLPEIDRLDDMLKNLLRMVEQPESKPRPASVEDLLYQAVDAVPLDNAIRQQTFDLHTPDDLPPALVDPAATRDALSYLLEYLAGHEPHPVLVEVGPEVDDPTGICIKMTRMTNANGELDPESILDPIHVMQDPDCPLGPVISRRIIANQRGRLSVSCINSRLSVVVSLPLCKASNATDQEVAQHGWQDSGS